MALRAVNKEKPLHIDQAFKSINCMGKSSIATKNKWKGRQYDKYKQIRLTILC